MILLFTFLLFLLGTVHFLVSRRVAALERRYGQAARDTDRLLNQSTLKPGNSNKLDAARTAKCQFLLGQMVQKRDRLEARHDRWLARAERLGRLRAWLRGWQGRKLPYTFGALDVYGAMYLIDRFGTGDVARMLDMMVTWLAR